MCHKRLTVNLAPRLNFIIGHNGSGKSAILTAITVCLGAKASATQRGTSFKALIREGCQASQVSCTLSNLGPEAYQPKLYGSKIIIQRKFTATGASTLRIRNAEGKEVTKKRDDLLAITDHFNIQVDNPINVLTQDMARQFLHNSTPEQKYKLFLKGTQLDFLEEANAKMHAELTRVEKAYNIKKRADEKLKEEMKDLLEKKKDMQEARRLNEVIAELQAKKDWAVVKGEEQKCQIEMDKLKTFETAVRSYAEKVKENTDQILLCDKQVNELEKKMEVRGRNVVEMENTVERLGQAIEVGIHRELSNCHVCSCTCFLILTVV